MSTIMRKISSVTMAVAMVLVACTASAGNTVAVNAKAEKGQVFAGWYTDLPFSDETAYVAADGVDYRTVSRTYDVGEVAALFPRFETEAADKVSIGFTFNPEPFYNSSATLSIPLSASVKSFSLPTLTVANLPTGLKFDAKTLSITGTPTKPGETKDVKFTIKNMSDKTGVAFTKTFKIGDAQAPSLPELRYNDANGYPAFTPGAAVDMANVLGAATMATLGAGGWTVTGLPAGMTFNAKTGAFAGAPTAANTSYLVTFKKGTGASAETATITLRTGALPKLTIATNIVDEAGLPVADAAVLKQIRLTGGGAYAANKAVTLSATAPKGYVFAGWMQGVAPASGGQDFRTASGYKFTMPADDTELTARFIPVSADYARVSDAQADTSHLEVGSEMDAAFIRDAVQSGSFPTVTVTGLPAGIKFDAKTLLLSGKATDKTAKWYDLVVTVKNAGGYTYTGIFGVSVNGGEPSEMDEIGVIYPVADFAALDDLVVGDDEAEWELPIPSELKVVARNLPAGLVLEREEQKAQGYTCDSVLGTPTKAGAYYVEFSGNAPGIGKIVTRKRVVVRDCGSVYISVLADGGGAASGSGVYAGGSTFKAVAKANSGAVFAGWRDRDGAVIVPDYGADYRALTYSEVVGPDTSAEFTAEFIPAAEDTVLAIVPCRKDYDDLGEAVMVPMEEGERWSLDNGDSWPKFHFAVESRSLPTVTVTGLPSGTSFDGAKDIECYPVLGSEVEVQMYRIRVKDKTKLSPGEYDITIAAKNASGVAASRRVTLKVDNYRNLSLPLDYEDGYLLAPGETFDIAALLPGVDLTGWTVTGLPAGMTFNARTGAITGAPTAPDKSYTVWFKKTGEEPATVTMRTKPYPVLSLTAERMPGLDSSINVSNVKFALTGAGSYPAEKQVAIKATAPTGWLFGEWQLDGKTYSQSPSATYTMGADDATLTAVFLHQSQDWLDFSEEVDESLTEAGYLAVNLALGEAFVVSAAGDLFDSASQATYTVKGLPTGLQFDAKTGAITGTATKEGRFYATVTAKNASGYTLTLLINVAVGNVEEEPEPEDLFANYSSLTVGNHYENYLGWKWAGNGYQSCSGLPTDLKIVEEIDDDGNRDYSAIGYATTPGWYNITLTTKDEGTTKKQTRMLPVVDIPTRYEFLSCDAARGSVTGGGVWTGGATKTIKATPKTGFVFAGWYRDAEFQEPATEAIVEHVGQDEWGYLSISSRGCDTDYRNASLTWVVGTNVPQRLYARFIPTAEATGETTVMVMSEADGDEDFVSLDDYTYTVIEDGELDGELKLRFDAETLPTVTVTGLPKGFTFSGLAFDGQARIEYDLWTVGARAEPGDYLVTLTIKNNGKTETVTFKICVGQYHLWELDQAGLQGAYSVDVGARSDNWLDMLGVDADLTSGSNLESGDWGSYSESWSWSVTGLPKGLTFNANTGKVTGTIAAVTAKTTYIVHIKKTVKHDEKSSSGSYSGTYSEEATTAMTVSPLPPWLVGTYYGLIDVGSGDYEWPNTLEVKIDAAGVASIKIIDVEGPDYMVKSNLSRVKGTDTWACDFTCDFGNGDSSEGCFTIKEYPLKDGVGFGILEGVENGSDENDEEYEGAWTAYQDVYAAKPKGVTLPTFKTADNKLTLSCENLTSTRFPGRMDPVSGTLTLKFGASGVVTPTWQGDEKFTMRSKHLSIVGVNDEEGTVTASLWVDGFCGVDHDEDEELAIGLEYKLVIPCEKDGTAKASEIQTTLIRMLICD